MSFAEKILLKFSYDPKTYQREMNPEGWTLHNALTNLYEVVPHLNDEIKDKKILDFGCGLGFQAIAFIQNGASEVLGLDIDEERLVKAKAMVHQHKLESKISFKAQLDVKEEGKFDLVVSQNSMEHFPQPQETLEIMYRALKPGGKILITFGPPWLSPYGAHMQYFTNMPWVHILFSEKTVMNVRKNFRNDGTISYVEGGLNKMTIGEFEHLMARNHLKVEYRKYDCLKKFNFLGLLPGIREFFINRVTVIVKK